MDLQCSYYLFLPSPTTSRSFSIASWQARFRDCNPDHQRAGYFNSRRLPCQRSEYIALWRCNCLETHSKAHLLTIPCKGKNLRNHTYINSTWWNYKSSINASWFPHIHHSSCYWKTSPEIWYRDGWIVQVRSCWSRSGASASVSCD